MILIKSMIIALIGIICIFMIVSFIENKILEENARLQEIIKLRERREQILFSALNLIKNDINLVLSTYVDEEDKVQILKENHDFITKLEKASKENDNA